MTKRHDARAIRPWLLTVPCLCATGILASPLTARADQTLDDLIVSALRTPTEAGKTTAFVTVLDTEELHERGIYEYAINTGRGIEIRGPAPLGEGLLTGVARSLVDIPLQSQPNGH